MKQLAPEYSGLPGADTVYRLQEELEDIELEPDKLTYFELELENPKGSRDVTLMLKAKFDPDINLVHRVSGWVYYSHQDTTEEMLKVYVSILNKSKFTIGDVTCDIEILCY